MDEQMIKKALILDLPLDLIEELGGRLPDAIDARVAGATVGQIQRHKDSLGLLEAVVKLTWNTAADVADRFARLNMLRENNNE